MGCVTYRCDLLSSLLKIVRLVVVIDNPNSFFGLRRYYVEKIDIIFFKEVVNPKIKRYRKYRSRAVVGYEKGHCRCFKSAAKFIR